MGEPTAAIVIIGNEILSGKVVDINTPFLTQQLWALGVSVRRVVVIPDEVACIATEVALASQHHDFVFTSGGVGPTHDDVTMEGIAQAFGRHAEGHPHLLDMLRAYFQTDTLTQAQERLAETPQGAHLVFEPALRYPVVTVENVYIFPGIPSLLQEKFRAIAHRFSGTSFHLRQLRVLMNETDLSPLLYRVAEQWPAVAIGSYPQDQEVLITLEGRDEQAVEQAWAAVQSGVSDRLVPTSLSGLRPAAPADGAQTAASGLRPPAGADGAQTGAPGGRRGEGTSR